MCVCVCVCVHARARLCERASVRARVLCVYGGIVRGCGRLCVRAFVRVHVHVCVNLGVTLTITRTHALIHTALQKGAEVRNKTKMAMFKIHRGLLSPPPSQSHSPPPSPLPSPIFSPPSSPPPFLLPLVQLLLPSSFYPFLSSFLRLPPPITPPSPDSGMLLSALPATPALSQHLPTCSTHTTWAPPVFLNVVSEVLA